MTNGRNCQLPMADWGVGCETARRLGALLSMMVQYSTGKEEARSQKSEVARQKQEDGRGGVVEWFGP